MYLSMPSSTLSIRLLYCIAGLHTVDLPVPVADCDLKGSEGGCLMLYLGTTINGVAGIDFSWVSTSVWPQLGGGLTPHLPLCKLSRRALIV